MVSNLAPIIKFVNFLQKTFFKTLFKHYATNNSMRDILNSKQHNIGNFLIFVLKEINKSIFLNRNV